MAQFHRRLTGLDIVKQVCGQLGLPVPQLVVSDPTNAIAQQMWWLLNDAGEKLLKPNNGHRWQVLKRTWTLITVPGQTLYDLPSDFDSMVDQTAWCQTSQSVMLGVSHSDPYWQAVTVRTLGAATMDILYRFRGDQLQLFYVPSEPQTLMFDYTSRGWVKTTGVSGTYTDQLADDGDMCMYEPSLIKANLKLRFMQEKGFDTTTAQNDFDLALELAINGDFDAPIIEMVPPLGDASLLDVNNIPAGIVGSVGPTGPEGPVGAQGAQGDVGPIGPPGPGSVLYGTTDPTPAVGDPGQFYLNTITGQWYGPKGSDGSWPIVTTIGYWG